MYRGKHAANGGGKHRKSIILLLSLVLIFALVIGGTVAYLIDETTSVVNTFTPSEVNIKIVEEFDGTTKSNVQIQNVQDADGKEIPAYIRVKIVKNWVTADGKILPGIPDGCTEEIKYGDLKNWTYNAEDGFYYYNLVVNPGDSTDVLISSATYKTTGNGEALQIEIIAQAVQASLGTTAQAAFVAAGTVG